MRSPVPSDEDLVKSSDFFAGADEHRPGHLKTAVAQFVGIESRRIRPQRHSQLGDWLRRVHCLRKLRDLRRGSRVSEENGSFQRPHRQKNIPVIIIVNLCPLKGLK